MSSAGLELLTIRRRAFEDSNPRPRHSDDWDDPLAYYVA